MKKTNFLNLILPNSSVENWGSTYNKNFEIIDSQMASLNSRMNNVDIQIGDLGYLKIDENQPYLNFDIDNNTFITSTYPNGSGNYTVYGFESDEGKKSFRDIKDYTGFIVVNGIEADPNKQSPFNIKWTASDLLVKITVYDEFFNSSVKFIKFPQALGGFYVPTSALDQDRIIFKKVIGEYAADTISVEFPRKFWYVVLYEVEITDTTQPYNIPNENSDIARPNFVPVFYIKQDNIYRQIIVDYILYFENNQWKIKLENCNLAENETVLMRYIKTSGETLFDAIPEAEIRELFEE